MGNIQPKALTRLGINDNMARSMAMATIAKYCIHDTQQQILSTLEAIIHHPEDYRNDNIWGQLTSVLAPSTSDTTSTGMASMPSPASYASRMDKRAR